MVKLRCVLLVLGLGVASACGPRISEVRVVPTPAREASCQLEFVKQDMMDLSSPSGTWQVIGYVILGEGGLQDPFSERYRAIVRPRACAMGGEGVTVMLAATKEGLVTDGSTTSYGVLKRRSSAPEPPKSF